MNLLKQIASLFSGGGVASGGDVGLYYYVKCNRCGEIVQVRINPMNDLSHQDEGDGLFVRKVIVGKRCYNRIEAEFNYDKNRKLREKQATGGTFASKDAYEADQQSQVADKTP